VKAFRAVMAVGLLLVLAAATVWILQRSRYQDADLRLQHRLRVVKAEARALEAAAHRQREMEIELKLLRAKTDLLEHVLPSSLGLAEFRSSFEAECARRKLIVAGWEAREDTSQPLHRGEITVRLKGGPARVAELRARIGYMARLTDWSDGTRQGDVQEVRLTVFALPPPPAPHAPAAAPSACGTEDTSWVWLPPYPALLQAREEQINQACARNASLGLATQVAAEREASRQHLYAIVAAVEKLRATHTRPSY
jgi:hypothetical protein